MAKHEDDGVIVEKGAGLARGPALILGTILLAAGLYFLYKQNQFPKLSAFPDATSKPDGKVLFGIFGANGWTGMFTAIAGGLLLFGAAQHLLAKTMSLVVGLALGACSVIALVDGDDVLGLAAANGWTKLGWGAAAAILLVNSLLPRIRHTRPAPDADRSHRPVAAPVREREAPARTAPARTAPVQERAPLRDPEPARDVVRGRELDRDRDRSLVDDDAGATDGATGPGGDATRVDGAGGSVSDDARR